eukprot:528162_1
MDIDEKKKRRIMALKHMNGANEKSYSMRKELEDCFQHQKQKQAELVTKLNNKIQQQKIRKKMRQFKEDHENRLHELENEVIPSLNDKIRKEQNMSSKQQLQLNK